MKLFFILWKDGHAAYWWHEDEAALHKLRNVPVDYIGDVTSRAHKPPKK